MLHDTKANPYPVDSEARVGAAVAEIVTAASGTPVGLEDDLLKSQIVTSLTVMKIIYAIEEDFGISIHEDEINRANFHTARAIANLVLKQLRS